MCRPALGVLMALALVPETRAAGPADEAREATKRGTAFYNLGQFEDAAREYESAYKLVQEPTLLYNIGQSYRQAGKTEKAIIAYRAYLRTAPANAPNRSQVEQRVRELEAIVEKTREAQAGPPPGTLSPPPASPPPAQPPPPPAGTAARTGPPPLTVSPAAAPPPPAPAPEPKASPLVTAKAPESEPSPQPPLHKRWWFWAAIGGVVVTGVTTALILGRDTTNPDCLRIPTCGVVP